MTFDDLSEAERRRLSELASSTTIPPDEDNPSVAFLASILHRILCDNGDKEDYEREQREY